MGRTRQHWGGPPALGRRDRTYLQCPSSPLLPARSVSPPSLASVDCLLFSTFVKCIFLTCQFPFSSCIVNVRGFSLCTRCRTQDRQIKNSSWPPPHFSSVWVCSWCSLFLKRPEEIPTNLFVFAPGASSPCHMRALLDLRGPHFMAPGFP